MLKGEFRKKQIRLRKNFFPTLIVIIILITMLALIITYVSPDNPGIIFLFFIFLFSIILFSTSMAFANSRRGLLTAIGSTIFVILRYVGIGSLINFLLIFALCVSCEIYLSKKWQIEENNYWHEMRLGYTAFTLNLMTSSTLSRAWFPLREDDI